jgi:hypothetical protein
VRDLCAGQLPNFRRIDRRNRCDRKSVTFARANSRSCMVFTAQRGEAAVNSANMTSGCAMSTSYTSGASEQELA